MFIKLLQNLQQVVSLQRLKNPKRFKIRLKQLQKY